MRNKLILVSLVLCVVYLVISRFGNELPNQKQKSNEFVKFVAEQMKGK